ncbi:hypothetical protein V6N11_004767 [Hibiscus sabdariffa]|uniref:Nodulin-like domain-containing protein n=1 Tax=Hibiscus sabdariffa TaxID=183260 RepID=A0ABR2SHX8_9ROSI
MFCSLVLCTILLVMVGFGSLFLGKFQFCLCGYVRLNICGNQWPDLLQFGCTVLLCAKLPQEQGSSDQASLILMLALGSSMVVVAFMFILRIVQGHRQVRSSDGLSFALVYSVCLNSIVDKVVLDRLCSSIIGTTVKTISVDKLSGSMISNGLDDFEENNGGVQVHSQGRVEGSKLPPFGGIIHSTNSEGCAESFLEIAFMNASEVSSLAIKNREHLTLDILERRIEMKNGNTEAFAHESDVEPEQVNLFPEL